MHTRIDDSGVFITTATVRNGHSCPRVSPHEELSEDSEADFSQAGSLGKLHFTREPVGLRGFIETGMSRRRE